MLTFLCTTYLFTIIILELRSAFDLTISFFFREIFDLKFIPYGFCYYYVPTMLALLTNLPINLNLLRLKMISFLYIASNSHGQPQAFSLLHQQKSVFESSLEKLAVNQEMSKIGLYHTAYRQNIKCQKCERMGLNGFHIR